MHGIGKAHQLRLGLRRLPARLLGAFRVLAATKEELGDLLRGNRLPTQALSGDTEARALKWLRDTLQASSPKVPSSAKAKEAGTGGEVVRLFLEGQAKIAKQGVDLCGQALQDLPADNTSRRGS